MPQNMLQVHSTDQGQRTALYTWITIINDIEIISYEMKNIE